MTGRFVSPPEIPGYSDVAEIGRGGQGRVYRAFNDALGRFEAVKIYTGDGDAEERAAVAARFDHEARITGRISHPNVIVVYRSETAGDTPLLFLEYLDGSSLRTVIGGAEIAVSTRQLVAVLADVAAALDGLAAGPVPIVHQDVKPENILLERDGADGIGRAVLADFGVAQVLDGAIPRGTLSGSAPYMAPEQLLRRPLSPRTDQYGLACTAYELLTGRAPFTGTVLDRVADIADHAGTAPVERASRRNSRLPRRVDRVFARALATEPSGRYPTATAFVSALAEALGAPIDDAHRPVRRFIRRHRAVTAVAALALVAAATAGGVAIERSLIDHRTPVRPPLARPGIMSGCPDLSTVGLAADPRLESDRAAGAGLLYVTVTGDPGEYTVVDDLAGVGTRFYLDPGGFLRDGEATPGTVLSPTFGDPDCRYAADVTAPPNGAVVNVYTGAAADATGTPFAMRLRDRLRLGDPTVVEIGVDRDHKARIDVWERIGPPYATCIASVPGQDRADLSPLLVAHQHVDLPGSACETVEAVAAELLTRSWDSLTAERRRAAAVSVDDPRSPARPVDHDALLDATDPCADHAAIGLTRIGGFDHPGLTTACWHRDGHGRPVVLGHADEDFQSTASLAALRNVRGGMDLSAPPGAGPDYVPPPLTATFDLGGVSYEGGWVTVLPDTAPRDRLVPVIWTPLVGDVLDAEHLDRGLQLQRAMILRALGYRFPK